jgi:hypothetical protein
VGLTRKASVARAAPAAALPAQALAPVDRTTWLAGAGVCAADAGARALGGEAPPVLIDGLGTADLEPDTTDTKARQWFAQGLRLVWAYDEAEAIRAFRIAQQIDNGCALCFWGEALARSPTLNLQPPYVDVDAASEVAVRALKLVGKLERGDPRRGLIEAIALRAPTQGDSFDGEAYVQTMTRLAEEAVARATRGQELPNDNAILILAADSEIVRWSGSGAPTQGARTWLETVLKRKPAHSGAIHFYIHLADIIGHPEIARDYAPMLPKLAPAASHLIHMPSHTYYGDGDFRQAVDTNLRAIDAYGSFEKWQPVWSAYRRYLYAHDHHYAIQAAVISGDARRALAIARRFTEAFPAKDPLFRIRAAHYAAPWYALGRYGAVGAVLDVAEPATGFDGDIRSLSLAAWHYARGEAYVRSDQADRAPRIAEEARAIAALLDGPAGRALGAEGEALATIARYVLEGRAAMVAGRPADAISAYRAAMNVQNNANLQFDPPPFWYPVRRSLAAAMYRANDAAAARRQLVALLDGWQDPLALYLMSLVERRLGDPASADKYLKRAEAGWAGGKTVSQVPVEQI